MPDGMSSTTLPITPDRLHQTLAALNEQRFTPGVPHPGWEAEISELAEGLRLEGHFLEQARAEIAGRAAEAPTDADGFVAWFEELDRSGPGQSDPLFKWLAERATMAEMRWFLTQEVAGEAGFDDLCALTQVRLPEAAKLEIARNYWDEMGRGNPKGMHGPMLHKLSVQLGLEPTVENTVWESLALANTMAGLAANRRYTYHSVGAMGVIEETAPGRAKLVADGLKRLGVPAEDRHYFDLHAVLDIKHSASWNAEAIHPLVEANPELARAIAEGALMRLECGAACFRRYRQELGVSDA